MTAMTQLKQLEQRLVLRIAFSTCSKAALSALLVLHSQVLARSEPTAAFEASAS